MHLSQKDVDNIHALEKYLKGVPRTMGEIASHLEVPKGTAIIYLEIMAKNPRRYHLDCADLSGVEKRWVIR